MVNMAAALLDSLTLTQLLVAQKVEVPIFWPLSKCIMGYMQKINIQVHWLS